VLVGIRATLVVCCVFVRQKLQKVGQGVMRLAARKARKDVVTKQVYVSSQVRCLLMQICLMCSIDLVLSDFCHTWSLNIKVFVY